MDKFASLLVGPNTPLRRPASSPTQNLRFTPVTGMEHALRSPPEIGCTQTRADASHPAIVKLCNYCSQIGNLRCTRCKKVCYCSVACQTKDWKAHRHVCKPGVLDANSDKCLKLSSPPTGAAQSPPELKCSEVSVPKRLYLQDLPKPQVTAGAQVQASVVEMRSPGKFYIHIQTAAALEKLQKITASLQKTYKNTMDMEYLPHCREMCAVRYTQDRNWYRAAVQSVDVVYKTACVFYVDFGNEETVPLNLIKPLAPCIDLFAPFAVQCQLAGVSPVASSWSSECRFIMRHQVAGKSLTVTVENVLPHGDVWEVTIMLPTLGKTLSAYLVEQGYASLQSSRTDTDGNPALDNFKKALGGQKEQKDVQVTHTLVLKVGDVFPVVVTHLQSPEELICQKVENAGEIQQLQVKLWNYCVQTPVSGDFRPSPGTVCCSQFSLDSQWYRAKVLAYSSENSVCVGYVDFGNSEQVELNRLRAISPDLLQLPMQAIPCALSGVKPVCNEWSEEALTLLKKLLCNRILQAEVLGQRSSTAVVSLLDETLDPPISVAEQLVVSGHALAAKQETETETPTEKLQWTYAELPDDEQLVELVVSVVLSPGEFYCRRNTAEDVQALSELSAQLNEHCQNCSTTPDVTVGQPCCALLPGDNMWYRAMVQSSVAEGKLSVYFVDTGNSGELEVTDLRPILPPHLSLPFQALRCWLVGVHPVGDWWSAVALQRFQAVCASGPLLARVHCNTHTGYGVELQTNGFSIAALLVSEGLSCCNKEKPHLPPVSAPAECDVTVKEPPSEPITASVGTAPAGVCCCIELKQKVENMEVLLVQMMKQLQPCMESLLRRQTALD